MELGFIGLGSLGTIMVQHLIEKGRNIHLYNRSQEKMHPFKQHAELHPSLASIAASCDIIISIVSDDYALQAIAEGDDGLVAHLKPGSLHICLSTVSPAMSTSIAALHLARNIEYLTATVIGRPEAARSRNLVVCVSGISVKTEIVQEILTDLGAKKIYHFGDDPAAAAVIKICNNFLIIAAVEAMGEAFNLAKRAGADTEAFYTMITENIFNAPIYKNYGKIILDEKYEEPAFTAKLGLKDTRLALQLADETSTPLPLADLIRNRFLINQNRGRNGYDWTAIAKVIAEENG